MSSDPKSSNTKRAVEQLRQLIFEGELPPGSNHFEQDLAEKLGMSRTPVREAALTLEAQGLLCVQPRRGIHILGLSLRDMSEIYDILTELESLAAERAALADHPQERLNILNTSIAQMERAIEREDLDSWALADEVFHTELVRLAENRRLEEIVARSVDQVRRARKLTLYMRPLPRQSTQDHRMVLEAIARGDPTEARRIHADHRRNARDMMVRLLGQLGQRPL